MPHGCRKPSKGWVRSCGRILLGDSLGDVGMAEGLDYKNIIKIGFYNDPAEGSIEQFKKVYDVVLTGDQDFSFVNNLLEELVK